MAGEASRRIPPPQDEGERIGPFLLFGDPELIDRIRLALAE